MNTREVSINGKSLSFETGKLAKQAHGSVIVRYGDSVVLVTACHAASPREGIDFLPLTVDYREYTYASGRIPGGFFKREGKPAEKEVLTSRVIDRPIRPLFPSGWRHETQIIALVLSADQENDTDVLAITGASAAPSTARARKRCWSRSPKRCESAERWRTTTASTKCSTSSSPPFPREKSSGSSRPSRSSRSSRSVCSATKCSSAACGSTAAVST